MAEVTICIPAYQSQQFIAQTLRSVQRQTYNDFCVEIAIEPTEDSERVWQACETFLVDKRFNARENSQILGWAENINSLFKTSNNTLLHYLTPRRSLHPAYINTLLSTLKDKPQCSVAYADMLKFGTVKGRRFMSIKQGSLAKRLLSFYLAGAIAVALAGSNSK